MSPSPMSLRLSEGQTLVLDSFDHEMAGVSDEQILSYQATFPLDLSPVKDGMIRVEQASNQPVDLVLTRYSPSLKSVLATNETEFGQTIDFGFDYVQWNHVHLSGLDGSSLTITMEESCPNNQRKNLGSCIPAVKADWG